MSDTNAQEPTMEEILASIRRIISEDDQPQASAEAAAAEPQAPAPAPAPEPARSEPPRPEPAMAAPTAPSPARPAPPAETAAPDDDVLELTDPVDPPRAAPTKPPYVETVGDLDVFSSAEPSSPAPPKPRPAAPAFADEPLIGSYAAEQSAGHFGALARSMAMPREGRTLEDVVREMLKPMLRDWLDQYLPSIVEARVQAEVERISRRQDY